MRCGYFPNNPRPSSSRHSLQAGGGIAGGRWEGSAVCQSHLLGPSARLFLRGRATAYCLFTYCTRYPIDYVGTKISARNPKGGLKILLAFVLDGCADCVPTCRIHQQTDKACCAVLCMYPAAPSVIWVSASRRELGRASSRTAATATAKATAPSARKRFGFDADDRNVTIASAVDLDTQLTPPSWQTGRAAWISGWRCRRSGPSPA